MMNTVKVAVTWHKPGEVATARQQVWQMEVPASGETTAEQDLLLTLREDVEWHRTHDAGERTEAPGLPELAAAVTAINAAADARREEDAARHERQEAEKREREAAEVVKYTEAAQNYVNRGGDPVGRGTILQSLVMAPELAWNYKRITSKLPAELVEAVEAQFEADRKAHFARVEDDKRGVAAREAARQAEITAWAQEHGSDRLKAQIEAGLDGWPLYLHERLGADLGEAAQLCKSAAEWDLADNPTLPQLQQRARVAALPGVVSAEVRLRDDDLYDWDEDEEGASYTGFVVARWRPGSKAFELYTVTIPA